MIAFAEAREPGSFESGDVDGYVLSIAIPSNEAISSAVFFAGVVGDTSGGIISDAILRRKGDPQSARRNVIVGAMVGAGICLGLVFTTANLTLDALFLCRKHCRPSRAREHRFAKRADRRATGVCRPQAIQHATGAARTAAFSILAERDAALEAPIEIEPPL